MMKDQDKVDRLSDAAIEIYKYYEKGKGFYSGTEVDPVTNKTVKIYNSWEAGLRRVLESELKRALTADEQTIISLAIGRGPTPSLTKRERLYSMEYLWDEEYPRFTDGECQELMRVLTCF